MLPFGAVLAVACVVGPVPAASAFPLRSPATTATVPSTAAPSRPSRPSVGSDMASSFRSATLPATRSDGSLSARARIRPSAASLSMSSRTEDRNRNAPADTEERTDEPSNEPTPSQAQNGSNCSDGGHDDDDTSRTPFHKNIVEGIPFIHLFKRDNRLPPLKVQDFDLLFYDIFLLLNLTTSISFWVTHRLSVQFLGSAFSEGCLLSIFWILSGLYHGSFLWTSVDGHYASSDQRAGPKAAATLALNTFVNAVNLRLVFALGTAILQHRPVGSDPAEQLLPLEIAVGLVLMSAWRALHSYYTPRL